MGRLKSILRKHITLVKFVTNIYNRLPFNNHFHFNSRKITSNNAIFSKSDFLIKGIGNEVNIGELSRLVNCRIYISGNNNKIIVGDNCYLKDVELYIEDSDGSISIGNGTSICGKTHIACIEGKRVSIGDDCMFSSDITIRVGDSHSIIDKTSEMRINPSKDVIIGNHVWIGNHVIILKNTYIPNDSIVGTGSIVTKKFDNENILIAGNPAKIIKENITWDGMRI